ncbi:hypothetical protein VOWphi5012_067 [Vibrio phage phi50-12]|uniref:Uncharacterized protein n=1 Tax=Vibrio phage phi50-12 TaxID=2654972 RepID=A0A5P8PSS9_9CAUD|nr:hypothetical protein KNU82_gp067 [Vibrio phage phi50-12]QFR59851.1 hypothetical protein VOWphi5012_067 [Vibrio phage phi50-12]
MLRAILLTIVTVFEYVVIIICISLGVFLGGILLNGLLQGVAI